jgi:phosphoenolpyruvate carboxykinase (ATP)
MKSSVSSGPGALSFAVETIENPTQAELAELALQHTPCTHRTYHKNIVKVSRNKARMAKFTYVIADEADAEEYSAGVIAPAKARELIQRQKAYIEKQGKIIQIDGYLGLGERAVPGQWVYTLEGANIAAMQQILSFPRKDVEDAAQLASPFRPALRVIYTPGMFVEDMPGRQAILVDLHTYTTYVMGPDYFGESKKGALRMLNDMAYQQGGLVLHAGAKEVQIGNDRITMTIMGLSGTGKTTTTFSKQGDLTRPIQDDMVVLWPNGGCTVTENGCFAKTWGLTEETEPVIYRGTLDPTAWVENVYTDAEGRFDFSKQQLDAGEVERLRDVLVETGADAGKVDDYISGKVSYEDVVDEHGTPKDGWDFVSWTQNGRSIIPMAAIEDAADLTDIPPVRSMGILNRDEGNDACMPGLVRFTSPQQAAGYFMLGETTKTSAAGKDRGKTRSPFTQPFFPRKHSLQAQRFSELAATMPGVDVWLMNTGFVGGDALDVKAGRALKVKIRHSSAMLEAMLGGAVKWKKDPDWNYEIVDVDAPENAALLETVPAEILNPVRFYESQGRQDEYRAWVESMRTQRREFLKKFDVADSIVQAVVG